MSPDVGGDGERIVEQLDGVSKEAAREYIGRWFSNSQELLYHRGDRHDYDVASVAQSAIPPQWDDSEGAWVFGYPHTAAIYFNNGADPHPIEADSAEMLAFEWPKMKGVEFGDTGQTFDEVFESTWPTVFLKKVNHPGMEALRFVDDGWRPVGREMQ